MRIYKNPNTEIADAVMKALKDNDHYCPCKLDKVPENKCICKEFREQECGLCHCGLYIKEPD